MLLPRHNRNRKCSDQASDEAHQVHLRHLRSIFGSVIRVDQLRVDAVFARQPIDDLVDYPIRKTAAQQQTAHLAPKAQRVGPRQRRQTRCLRLHRLVSLSRRIAVGQRSLDCFAIYPALA